MTTDNVLQRGRVLTAFRENAGVTLSTLAKSINLSVPALSMYEHGQRGKRIESSRAILDAAAKVLNADSALYDMWVAAETALGLPAWPDWRHNPSNAGGPGWVWLRLGDDASERVVHLRWGVFAGTCEVPLRGNGVIVTYPFSVANPALEVTFSAAGGWADFGTGSIPLGVAQRLDIQILRPGDILRAQPPEQPEVDRRRDGQWILLLETGLALARNLTRSSLGIGWQLIQPHVSVMRPSQRSYPLDGRSIDRNLETTRRENLELNLAVSPDNLRGLRETRTLSRKEVAVRVSALDTSLRVPEKAIERLEAGNTDVIDKYDELLPRLDTVYLADGRLGTHRCYGPRRADEHSISFPSYWRGPIWLQAATTDPGAQGEIVLTWGPWRRRQDVISGLVVTTRKSEVGQPNLRVVVPKGWTLSAGTGSVPAALDVSGSWTPSGVQAALYLLLNGLQKITRHSE